jgi:hypothetical protein
MNGNVIVLSIVGFLAAAYIVLKVRKAVTKADCGCGCGSCGKSCEKTNLRDKSQI